jgi:membrane protease YdiL (CAAX protease family)
VKGEGWVLAAAMVLPTVAAAGYFVGLSSDESAEPYFRLAYGGSKAVQFLLPVVWLSIADRTALKRPRLSFRGVPTGLIFGVVVAASVLALYQGWLAGSPLFAGLPAAVRAVVSKHRAATPAGYLLLAVFLAVVHSLLEEYYWRWFVYGRLRHCHVPRLPALVLAGLAFMGHHVVILGVYFPGRFWPAVLPFSLGVAVGGVFWAWIYERTGSILGPWVSHFLVDSALMAVGYDLVFGSG